MIYEHIKGLCDLKKISITFLEKELGFGRGTIQKWKNSSPSVENLQTVATYFKKPITFFLKEEPKKTG